VGGLRDIAKADLENAGPLDEAGLDRPRRGDDAARRPALEIGLPAIYARRDPGTAVEMGDVLVGYGRYAEAQRRYGQVAKADPKNKLVRGRLTTVDRLIAQHKAP
jgi:hypothetical protein